MVATMVRKKHVGGRKHHGGHLWKSDKGGDILW